MRNLLGECANFRAPISARYADASAIGGAISARAWSASPGKGSEVLTYAYSFWREDAVVSEGFPTFRERNEKLRKFHDLRCRILCEGK